MPITTINTTQIRDGNVTAVKVASDVVIAAGTHAFTGNQSMGGNRLTSLANATTGTDAVNKDDMDAAIASAVTGLMDLKGGTDCSANPNYPAASKGDAYTVTVGGKIGGASGKSVDAGDVYFATADNAGGTEASVGTSWQVIEHNLVGALLAANNLSDVANAGTARTNLGVGTGDSPQFTGVNVGHATDTTVTRASAGDIAVEGNLIYRAGGTDVPVADGGTGASTAAGARTNLGATTVGANVFTIANPSAITFFRVNADNSVDLLSAASFRTAIGASGGTQAVRETPSGSVNGSNVTFTLVNTPVAGSEMVFLNGILQDAGAGNDYTISGGTITYLTAPVSGDKIRVTYTY